MAKATDPTEPIRREAAKFAHVTEGKSCTQSSFKVGKVAFLYIGPGARGAGFKAMLKLNRSVPQARKLAAAEPDRYSIGSNDWVAVRFTAEKPIPRTLWQKWLRESYGIASAANGAGKGKTTTKKVAKKKGTGK